MRLVHAAALTAAVLLLASVESAQGLGDAAAKERKKRKAEPAKPAKVFTDDDIGPSMAPVAPDLPVTAEGGGGPGRGPAARRGAARGRGTARRRRGAGSEGSPPSRARLPPRAPRLPCRRPRRSGRRPRRRRGQGRGGLEEEARAGPQGSGRLPGRDRPAPARAQRHERRHLHPGPRRRRCLRGREEGLAGAGPGTLATLEEEGRRNGYR